MQAYSCIKISQYFAKERNELNRFTGDTDWAKLIPLINNIQSNLVISN